jgi:hypothetical protein
MLYDTMKSIGSYFNALNLGFYMARKAWNAPSSKGALRFKEHVMDALAGVGFQLGCSAYFELYKALAYSTKWLDGTFVRLFKLEKNPQVKEMFRKYVENFAWNINDDLA